MPLQTDFRKTFKKASVPAKRIMGTIKSGERIYDEEFTFQDGLKFALTKDFDLDNFSNDTDVHVKKDGTVIVEEWAPIPKEDVGK